jgi:hypothetical protein
MNIHFGGLDFRSFVSIVVSPEFIHLILIGCYVLVIMEIVSMKLAECELE